MKLFLIFLLCVSTVYATLRVRQEYDLRRKLIVISLAEGEQGCEAAWERQVEKHYPGAVLVFAHGGDVNGEWCLRPYVFEKGPFGVQRATRSVTVHDEIAEIHKWYPGRLIVLIACNPEHHILYNEHGVIYADRDVWVTPDSDFTPLRGEIEGYDGNIGRISDFLHAE